MGDEGEYHPRLCTIRKWADFNGYGFNLHAEKGRAGQYIGKVDDESPAEAAGMKEGDRIVEVEGVNIGNENHSQVVTRIKAAGDSVTMLLVDSDTDKYFKEQKLVVSSDMDEVVRLSTPPRPGTEEQEDEEVPHPPPDTEPPEEPPSYNDVQKDEEENQEPEKEPEREPTPEPEPEREPTPEPEPERESAPEPEPEPVVIATSPPVEYHPRLCHLIKVPDFNGYGFNLHGEKDVQGQYIGVVDEGSPASGAGLKTGDRIVEVNGMNIEQSTHQDVILKIKAGGNETKLLVVDKETDDYYKNNGIPIVSSSSDVVSKCNVDKDELQQEPPAMEFSPRLCHISKWPDFNGYGFNLHAEKEKGAQYIGKIDDNSPAQDGGLRERDRIIEVNGVNIEDESHRQVISRIKEGGDETKLLVVDQEADNYFKSRGISVTSSMPNVQFLQTTRKTAAVTTTVTNGESRPTRTEPVTNSAPTVQANGGGDFLSMNLSAKEMRERIAAKKKIDPKQRSNMDFKTKYDMFQKL